MSAQPAVPGAGGAPPARKSGLAPRDRAAVGLMLAGAACWLLAIVIDQPFQRIQLDPVGLPWGALRAALSLFALGFVLAFIGYRLGPGRRKS